MTIETYINERFSRLKETFYIESFQTAYGIITDKRKKKNTISHSAFEVYNCHR